MANAADWGQIHLALSARFPESEIKQRPGKGNKTYSYIDARAVEDRLDEVVGPDNWTDRYESVGDLAEKALQCFLTIHGVTKCGVGYPNSDKDEEPYKAAESDALKRAAVKFGIGRFLYGEAPARQGQPTQNGHAPSGAKMDAPRKSQNDLIDIAKAYCGMADVTFADALKQAYAEQAAKGFTLPPSESFKQWPTGTGYGALYLWFESHMPKLNPVPAGDEELAF